MRCNFNLLPRAFIPRVEFWLFLVELCTECKGSGYALRSRALELSERMEERSQLAQHWEFLFIPLDEVPWGRVRGDFLPGQIVLTGAKNLVFG